MTSLQVVLALMFITAITTSAHQDPIGDIHPQVKVENGNFAIYFSNTARENEPSDYDVSSGGPVYRMVYSPTGELLGPRALVSNVRADELWQSASMVYDKAFTVGNERVLFDAELLKNGKPSYFVERDGMAQHRRLPWPDDIKIDYVASVHVDEKSLVISATTADRVLRLFYFERGRFHPPPATVVGTPTYIYDFPGASNVIFAADRYWVAWVRTNPEKKRYETVLSRWKPGEDKPNETILDAPSDWNTALSVGAIGNRLCLAYHCSVTGEYPGYSRLVVLFPEAK